MAQYGGDGQWVLDILHSWGCRLELRVALLAQGTRVFGFDVQNEKNILNETRHPFIVNVQWTYHDQTYL